LLGVEFPNAMKNPGSLAQFARPETNDLTHTAVLLKCARTLISLLMKTNSISGAGSGFGTDRPRQSIAQAGIMAESGCPDSRLLREVAA
jgi:hypothetical protein